MKQIYSNKIAYHNKLQAAHYRKQWKQGVRQVSKRTQIFKVRQELAAVEKTLGVDKLRRQLFAARHAEEKDDAKIAELTQQIATLTHNSPKWNKLKAKIKEIKHTFHDLELTKWTQKEVKIAAQKVDKEEITLNKVKHLSKQFAIEVQVALINRRDAAMTKKYFERVFLYLFSHLQLSQEYVKTIRRSLETIKVYDEEGNYMSSEDLYQTLAFDSLKQLGKISRKKTYDALILGSNYAGIYKKCEELTWRVRQAIKEIQPCYDALERLQHEIEKATKCKVFGPFGLNIEQNAAQRLYAKAAPKYQLQILLYRRTWFANLNQYIDSTDLLAELDKEIAEVKQIIGDEND